MQYLGGKARIARHIVGAILADTDLRSVWFEPFVGGANVLEHAAPHFARCYAADAHHDLILMWEHVTAGGLLPAVISCDEYAALRHAEPSWLRGLAGFGAAFGGRWFAGYGAQRIDKRHPYGHVYPGTRKTVERQAGIFARHGVRFTLSRFGDIAPPYGSVVYCDPPYAGCEGYAVGEFDRDAYYKTIQAWATDCAVYASEYAMPAEVPSRLVWSGKRRSSIKATDNTEVRTERLFRILA